MKKSLLLILPAALIVAGCSGNLKKGDIFNEKFMKQNYSVNEVSVENEGWHKTLLNLGSDINAVAPVVTPNVNGILKRCIIQSILIDRKAVLCNQNPR